MCARRNSLATVILASTSSQFNCEHFDLKVLNQPAPPPFKESVRCAEQNLYVRSQELVGDRDPRQHEFSVQLRAFDSAKTGSGVGVGVLLALCSSLLQK